MLAHVLPVGVALLAGLLIVCVAGRWYCIKRRIRRVLDAAARDLELARKDLT